MIRTHCPTCRTPFDVDEGLVGEKGECSNCGSKFYITRPDPGTTRPDGKTTQPMNAEPDSRTATPAPDKPVVFPAFLATLIAGGTGYAYWHLRNRPAPAFLDGWEDFLAMAHPLAVHFPVAAILLVALLGIVGGRKRLHDGAIRWLLWINLLACASGILLGHFASAEYSEQKLRNHLLSGLVVGGCSYLALFFFLLRSGSATTALYRLSLSGAVVAVALAGHFGATLTHGEIMNELPWVKKSAPAKENPPAQDPPASPPAPLPAAPAVNPNAPPAPSAPPPAAPTTPPTPPPAIPSVLPPVENAAASAVAHDEKSIFDAVIQPILNARCTSCHGEKKQKGEIRLDFYAELFNSGESGKSSVVAKNSAQSESVIRMLLPQDDEDHMPPPKKTQHTAEELDVFKWWIDAGADREIKIKSAPADLIEKLRSLAQKPPQSAST
ncbi:MAG: hypothetical protein KA004_08815 [Verrucomicrobiales bacterium]|nr:hypothetical protein [Verrucomicrobiales bacterium]